MEQLKGMTILIGRETGGNHLALMLTSAKGNKCTIVDPKRVVPGSVSRLSADGSAAHCKIEVDSSGHMLLTNLRPHNVTYVGGAEVEAKRIDDTSSVMLGKDKFALDVSLVLHTAIKLAAGKLASGTSPEGKKVFSISHLRQVWEDYDSAMEAIERRQRKLGKRRLVPIIIGSAFALLSAFCPAIRIYAGALSLASYLWVFFQKDTSIEDRKRAKASLMKHYVCPNEACRHFIGFKDYDILRQDKRCPYCGCTFTGDDSSSQQPPSTP